MKRESSNKANGVDWETIPIVFLIILLILIVTLAYNIKEAMIESREDLPQLEAIPIEQEEETPDKEEVFEETVTLEEEAEPRLSDRDIIAMVVMAEAGGEKFVGKVAVAAAVLNRSSLWGRTIESVASEKDQFIYPYYGTVSVACYEAVDFALENRDLFPKNMIYFRNTMYHEDLGLPYMQIGGHYFSTEGLPEYEIESLGDKD